MQGMRSCRLLRWILTVSIGLGAPGLIAIAVLLLASDCEPPDDRDLICVPEPIPDEENGSLLLAAINQLVWSDQKAREVRVLLQGDVMDLEKARQLLQEGQKLLDVFQATTLAPRFGDCQQNWFYYQSVRTAGTIDMALLAALKARVLFQEESEEAGFHMALDIVRLGSRMRGGGDFLTRMIGKTFQSIGMTRIRTFLRHSRLGAGALIGFAQRLSCDLNDSTTYIAACKVDYTQTAASIDRIAEGEAAYPRLLLLLFKKNKTKVRLAEHYRRHIRNATRPYAQMDLEGEDSAWGVPRLDALTNYFGERWVHFTGSFLVVECCDRAEIQATRLILALKAYNMEKGGLPATLDELPPRYIDAVPADPFDGRPMRYSAERRVVWSIGADLVDSGGNRRPEDRDEPSFPIEWR